MADRFEGLDLDHILLSLKKLARMHAASIIIHEKDPKAFKQFDTGFFTRKTDVFDVVFESLCDALIQEIPQWKGYEHYEEKLKNVRKNLVKNARRAFDCDEGDLHVLTHGNLKEFKNKSCGCLQETSYKKRIFSFFKVTYGQIISCLSTMQLDHQATQCFMTFNLLFMVMPPAVFTYTNLPRRPIQIGCDAK